MSLIACCLDEIRPSTVTYTMREALSQVLSAIFSTRCDDPVRGVRDRARRTVREYMMNDDEILAEFRSADALLEGHFILSSGLRSPRYLQCARVLMNPRRAGRLATELVSRIPADLKSQITAVVSPAMGGVIAGQEVARALGVDAMFVERPTGTFELRRGFRLEQGQQVLMMEDVVTTGLSSREAIAAIEAAGGKVIAAASLVDRSGGAAQFDVPFFPLIRLDVPTYDPDSLPPELEAIPAIKPGSRAAA